MDTTDPLIQFDSEGVCNYCNGYDAMDFLHYSKAEGMRRLEPILQKIKREGKRNEYDCIMGLSGGIDSSYAALRSVELGLRPLFVHFDSGWNSELSVRNIENIVKHLGHDLSTTVCDWEEMRSLQRSFFLSGLVNCDVPQDHAFIAVLYQTAADNGIRYWISGHNRATESVMSPAWRGYTSQDWTHIRSVHAHFGGKPLVRYPHYTFFDRFVRYPYLKRIRSVNILDYLEYNKSSAKEYLERTVGWRDYGGKHRESILTRFFQGHYLIERFGYDKRKAHLSSLIVSGQLSREDALDELSRPAYSDNELSDDRDFVLKKLGFTEAEWQGVLSGPHRTERDFGSDERLFHVLNLRTVPGKVVRKVYPNWRRR